MILTTSATCQNIQVTTPLSDALELWYSGEITTNLNFYTSVNCCKTTVTLAPRYAFGGTISGCVKNSSDITFTLTINGIPLANVTAVTVLSTTATSATAGANLLTWTVLVPAASTSFNVRFSITTTTGAVYTMYYNFTNSGGTCGTLALNSVITTYPALPCGASFNAGTNTLTLYSPAFGYDDCRDCEAVLTTCPVLPDGIYTVSINGETACSFVNCSTTCEMVSKVEECYPYNFEALFVHDALTAGSTITGNSDQNPEGCVTCSQLCELYKGLTGYLNAVCPTQDDPCLTGSTIPCTTATTNCTSC